jgi:hypothetical protein
LASATSADEESPEFHARSSQSKSNYIILPLLLAVFGVHACVRRGILPLA